MQRLLGGVGLGHRPELAADLLARRLPVDFLEIVAESCSQPRALREAAALGEMWPLALLASMPLDRVGMLHVAGGALEHGFYYDTHAHALSEAVLALTARALEWCGRSVPILLERDADFGCVDALAEELRRLHVLLD